MTRALGTYLLVVGLIGVILPFVPDPGLAMFLTPRIGWSMLGPELASSILAPIATRLHADPRWLVTEGIPGLWIMALGIAFLMGKRPLKTYLASEAILGLLPTLAFDLYALIHDDIQFFDRGFVPVMLIAWVVFSLIPFLIAIKALREGRRKVDSAHTMTPSVHG